MNENGRGENEIKAKSKMNKNGEQCASVVPLQERREYKKAAPKGTGKAKGGRS